MKSKQRSYFLLLAATAVIPIRATFAQDAARGQQLYETFCGSCHYERVHQRDRDRSLVRSLQDLDAQVRRWSAQTGKPMSQDDLVDIAAYLNRSHYRLEK